jgi:hypothetical protein
MLEISTRCSGLAQLAISAAIIPPIDTPINEKDSVKSIFFDKRREYEDNDSFSKGGIQSINTGSNPAGK